ncbi:MAG TPA: hypothetical protein VF696_02400 [Candidatus Paceibacterota bacterium]|jgi:hypothetical protein
MDVQFDNEQFTSSSSSQVKRRDWADKLVARKVVRTRAQAQALLIGIAVVCFVAAIVIATSGGTPAPDPSFVPEIAAPPAT